MDNGLITGKEYRIIKVLLIITSLCALIMGIILLFSSLRELVIVLAETIIIQRVIDHERWHTILIQYAIILFFISILFFYLCLGKMPQKIANNMWKVYYYAKKLLFHDYIFSFVFLCLFLFFYVRLNINIMFIIVCWIINKLGFVDWLSKVFGKKEVKMALIITCVSILFFITVMLMFKLTIVMDWFYGFDSNRVLSDFTQVSANHYRVKVHPFYVLLWQSFYHLFCPLENKTTLAIRIIVCVFAGINNGIFSLFISRFTKDGLLNIIICAIMLCSFPQILHGSQELEAYIFTQSSIMLMILYFSIAFSKKEYNLPILLALSLFVSGNNIAYICIFVIYYIILLYHTSSSWSMIWNRILKFSIWFIVIFSVLLIIQTLFYGLSAPSNVFSMIRQILSEEGAYISINSTLSLMNYTKNFFNGALFWYLPFDIGSVFKQGWLWGVLLLLPVLYFKKIPQKLLFLAVITSVVFLFVFHRFYGSYRLILYSPVIMCMLVSMLTFITQVLPKKMTTSLCCTLLAVMIYINTIGTYSLHCINQYIFGSIDVVENYREYEANINRLKERIANYKGNYLFFFRDIENDSSSRSHSHLHDEIQHAYENNIIDIVILPTAEASKATKKFFFGLENRSKLIFENGELYDFVTGETLAPDP